MNLESVNRNLRSGAIRSLVVLGTFAAGLDQPLAELVPNYLPAIPTTGMAAYPEYEYVTGEQALVHYDGNPWAVWVSTPSGGINWDIFVYYPRQNYPQRGHGGSLERVKDWAYVHE